jgi:hypothetical protein
MRVLFVLLADEKPKTIDMIAAIDFISVYGKTFGIAEENLHGDNFYKYGEFTARRAIVKKAILPLLQNEMLDVYERDDGYYFQANDAGEAYCVSLTSEYAIEYAKTSKAAALYVGIKSDSEIIKEIMTQSTIGLRLGGYYE